MQAYLLVGLGGGLGAMARYAAGNWAGRVFGAGFPLGTMLINIFGSLAMGLLVGVLARTLPPGQEDIRLLVAVGVLGGFTTFSAFSLDAMTLFERGELAAAALYVLLSVVLSVLALYCGLLVTRLGAA